MVPTIPQGDFSLGPWDFPAESATPDPPAVRLRRRGPLDVPLGLGVGPREEGARPGLTPHRISAARPSDVTTRDAIIAGGYGRSSTLIARRSSIAR